MSRKFTALLLLVVSMSVPVYAAGSGRATGSSSAQSRVMATITKLKRIILRATEDLSIIGPTIPKP
jgi:hypothetical protein